MKISLIAIVLMLGVLTACSKQPVRDYDSSAACTAQGLKPEQPEFDDCVKKERSARMLKQQREEFEQRKADEEYWRQRRY